jgi:hypothetical protein
MKMGDAGPPVVECPFFEFTAARIGNEVIMRMRCADSASAEKMHDLLASASLDGDSVTLRLGKITRMGNTV